MRGIFFLSVANVGGLLLASSALAQTYDTPALWRDLHAGSPVNEVATALSKHPEIKSIKTKAGSKKKPPALKISMADGAIRVFGSAFSLDTEFDLLGKLANVTLVSKGACASEAPEKFGQIADALTEKYGAEQTGNAPLDGLRVRLALSKASVSEQNETVMFGYANDQVAVVLVGAFSVSKPPEYPYGSSALLRSLYGIAKAAYDATRSECRNTGHERVSYAIRYISRAAFDAEAKKIEDDNEREKEKASNNL